MPSLLASHDQFHFAQKNLKNLVLTNKELISKNMLQNNLNSSCIILVAFKILCRILSTLPGKSLKVPEFCFSSWKILGKVPSKLLFFLFVLFPVSHLMILFGYLKETVLHSILVD